MSLPEEAKQIVDSEQQILAEVLESLHAQLKRKLGRFRTEEMRARQLTSEIVKTRRDEDKALLASDEAVSHGLKLMQKEEAEQIDQMIKQPYFARMVVEEDSSGTPRTAEYRIGLTENSDCRIIDWRRAPVAKLFYEYREGDHYAEEIQGRDRSGTVVLRNHLDIKDSALRKITCRLGTIQLTQDGWAMSSASATRSENVLPQIAALLSKDQFSLISENYDRALLIQGVAGSGKTTIALHRLAWLVGRPDSDVQTTKCLVVMLSQSLKSYISKTLPSLAVQGVQLATLDEWLNFQVSALFPSLSVVDPSSEKPVVRRPDSSCPASIERVKRSMAMLRVLEEFLLQNPASPLSPEQILLKLLSQPQNILDRDETKLLSAALIQQARARAEKNFVDRTLDRCDDALMLRIYQMISKSVAMRDGSRSFYDHIIADEVQDLSPVEIAVILGSARNLQSATLIGDTAQKLDSGKDFPGWDKLRKYWSLKDSISSYVRLDLNYRSTLEIRRLADYIQNQRPSTSVEGRRGRIPIWFKCHSEDRGVQAAQEWLERAMDKYPTAITAVVTATASESKYVAGLLRPKFGPILRHGDEHDFSFEAGIVVCDVSAVRGLEFTNLLLWNASRASYPAQDEARNRLYVALTRARENVCIVSWGKHSPLLPSSFSPLLRCHDLSAEELEQEQRSSDRNDYGKSE